ncbi:MAG: hypothetical protein FWD69_10560 [Polyangiaceae bacterium]|nr:hypothetical protein [Polyangiaceae bacterium]
MIVTVLETLLAHADLIVALVEAIEGGASKEKLMKAIKAEMVAASDAVMHAELGGGS